MVSFVNFARIASICVGFHLGTFQGYFFHQDFWPNLNCPLEYQIKLVLICCFPGIEKMITHFRSNMKFEGSKPLASSVA